MPRTERPNRLSSLSDCTRACKLQPRNFCVTSRPSTPCGIADTELNFACRQQRPLPPVQTPNPSNASKQIALKLAVLQAHHHPQLEARDPTPELAQRRDQRPAMALVRLLPASATANWLSTPTDTPHGSIAYLPCTGKAPPISSVPEIPSLLRNTTNKFFTSSPQSFRAMRHAIYNKLQNAVPRKITSQVTQRRVGGNVTRPCDRVKPPKCETSLDEQDGVS